ncbi:DUF4279 domain-containing protein [Solibacillus sp. CAU 1738]|uniref:DUF4279 domain-containing protein n=1 Tax=Solibacillus sp. CAU 1738 TaxID=3140363 RepID=UPI0032610BFA
MEKTNAFAYISFVSNSDFDDDFPLEIVTERLRVLPTKTMKKGERTPYKGLTHFRFTSWVYGTDITDTLDVDDVLMPVIDMLEPRIHEIDLLKKELNLKAIIRIVIHIHNGYTPGFVIGTRASRVAAAIDADFDIDLYAYPYEELDEDL